MVDSSSQLDDRMSLGANLSLILGLVHEYRTISRSEICRITGLTRSTVAKLVTTICELGLAVERGTEQIDRVGRPSLSVEAAENLIAISVHPEVDYLEIKAVTFSGQIVLSQKTLYPEPVGPEQAVKDIVILMRSVMESLEASPENYRILGAGVIVPGQIDSLTGVVRQAPHLQWFEFPIRDLLMEQLNLKILIGNDASLGCKAEFLYGAAKGATEVVYLHGSSGLGGGVYTGGRELTGIGGYAAELGHVRISSSTQNDYSGIPGTLEALVRREDLEAVLGLSQVSDEELESVLLNQRTPVSSALAKKQLEALAIGVANFVNIFNPEIVVLAGFLSGLYRFDQKYFHLVLKRHTIPAALEGVSIFVAELGSNSLAIGASELIFEELIADPMAFTHILKPNQKQKQPPTIK
jgi:predicted NBD/HSP70 family sugar kinase